MHLNHRAPRSNSYLNSNSGLPAGADRDRILDNYLFTLLNSTQEAIFLVDTEGVVRITNENATRLLADFAGNPLAANARLVDVVPSHRKATVAQGIWAAGRGETVRYEALYPGCKWLDVVFSPIFSPRGDIREICCTIRDISSQKQMDERLQQSEALHRSLVESMSEGVLFMPAGGGAIMANESASAMLGVSRECLRTEGLLCSDLTWHDRSGKPVDIRESLFGPLQHGEPLRNRVLGLRRKGSGDPLSWISFNGECVRNRQGGWLRGHVFTFTNITDSLRNREERDLFSRVIRETSNMVVITDAQQRIEWANERFYQVTGYLPQETLHRTPGELLAGPGKDPGEVAKIREALRRGDVAAGEILNYGKSGRPFWSHYNIHPVRDENGRLVRYFSIQSDITEMKRIREDMIRERLEHQEMLALAAAGAQEEKMTEIGQELHDNVCQILAVTKLYLGPILKGRDDGRRNARQVAEYIQLAIDEIRQLSHQLVAPRFKGKSLRQVLEGMLPAYSRLGEVQLQLDRLHEEDWQEDIKLAVYRIVQEQLNNIQKHARATRVLLRIEEAGRNIYLTLRDNGLGFDVTRMADGIGFTNIRNRVEALNGTMHLDSSPGHGTELSLTIPLNRTEPQRRFSADQPGHDKGQSLR
ncbi:MAG TPA: PAS domain-containing protein [Chitinophagaceae bacterium]|nr:PAS domain-containing protein [Chitinophagaceae bacterium]